MIPRSERRVAVLLRDNIYDALREEILTCRLLPGEDLREQDLAERYAVSRSPVREALLRLERDRLVSVHPRQGYRIAPISVAAARDLLGFRAVLEPACAIAAARHAGDGELTALQEAAEFTGSAEEFIEYNRRFHVRLANAGGNRRIAGATHDLIGQADRLVRVSLGAIKGRDSEQLVSEHVAIAAAIARRDGRGAARLVRAHLQAAEKRILAALRRQAVVI